LFQTILLVGGLARPKLHPRSKSGAILRHSGLGRVIESVPLGGTKREVERQILCLTHCVQASGGALWSSGPHQYWSFRHHKGNWFDFKKEIRD
jgi:hypothetical protein